MSTNASHRYARDVIVHINGWPGTGKLTIGRLLAHRLGGRLLDNHTLMNPALALFEREDPRCWPLRQDIKAVVLDYAARTPPDLALVFTDALADIESDAAVFDAYRKLASVRASKLVSVMLACDPEENARRLVAKGRGEQH